MGGARLRLGDWIAGGSAIGLFAATFIPWYGQTVDTGGFLLLLQPTDGGNAWQVLGVEPILLSLAAVVTVGLVLWRAIGPGRREATRAPLAIGALSALLVLTRILFPPNLGFEIGGYITVGTTLASGPFVALGAACGIIVGGLVVPSWERWSRARRESLSASGSVPAS
jgi:hypothetical protein